MKAAHPACPNPHRGYSYVGQEKLSMVKDFEKGDRDHMVVMDIKVLKASRVKWRMGYRLKFSAFLGIF